ncbi:elongin A, like isoform X2 [Brienomyrus brachyistius]|uniref:elongin A, like isoform X2 n=1 Tax=Brienomyrus brachyistius TaxID=42636 RepID=UPI0020B26C10|nr:elongin A, like isoform X2 [Brienomyrus brachyistius]
MAATDTLKKVLRLKLKLKESSEMKTVMKALKKLQELDVTLDILAETGIGKTVNSLRKHGDAGEVAKTLVNEWKKLVPKESTSNNQDNHGCGKEKIKNEKISKEAVEGEGLPQKMCHFDKGQQRNSVSNCRKSNQSFKKEQRVSRQEPKDDSNANKSGSSNKLESSTKDLSVKENRSTERFSDKPHAHKYRSEQDEKRTSSQGGRTKELKIPPRGKQLDKVKPKSLDYSKSKNWGCGKNNEDAAGPIDNKIKATKGQEKVPDNDRRSDEGLETPTPSFESCLNYSLKMPKRKKKPCNDKTVKKLKASQSKSATSVKESDCETEPPEKASTGSVMDLLNVPLPTSLPECEDLSNFSYFEKKLEVEVSGVCEDAPVFTGQRLNRKMQVYSGSKIAYLPTMMTLYQQCIRVLQNNIDLLHEIGGVPFDILEPVLERCTPEQLLRIEGCNPVYIGVTDHLWERHCQREFRNEKLEEYESWREMYLRLSEERERKLKRLTKSIVSAHSGKPKGRQVKLAYIHSVAKPPRNVRVQQEIHGTAGPLPLPHALDKLRLITGTDTLLRNTTLSSIKPSFGESSRSSGTGPGPGSSQSQDPRKIKRVAPMMAKSLKAFKKQLCRR